MKKLFVVMASADKGQHWIICGVPFCLGIIAAEDKKTAKAMLEKEYEHLKNGSGRTPRKYFKIVEFTEVSE